MAPLNFTIKAQVVATVAVVKIALYWLNDPAVRELDQAEQV
ncbi:MAG: hypothetical protein ABSE40_15235 [Candidatus Sulfotelmatobacter sp.]